MPRHRPGRGLLRPVEQHGLALRHPRLRIHDARNLHRSLRRFHIPRVVRRAPICCFVFALTHLSCRPKFLLAKGRDEQAIDVLYKIAAFNKQPTPTLTIDDFRLLDKEFAERESITSDEPLQTGPRKLSTGELTKLRLRQAGGQFKHLKGFFATKRMIWLSVTLWIAYVRGFTPSLAAPS